MMQSCFANQVDYACGADSMVAMPALCFGAQALTRNLMHEASFYGLTAIQACGEPAQYYSTDGRHCDGQIGLYMPKCCAVSF